MAVIPFQWNAEALRELAAHWILDLGDYVDTLGIVADMEAELPQVSVERWRYYDLVGSREELDPIYLRIRDLILHQTGVAVLKCGSSLRADQARLIQLILGCKFGENVTQTAEGDGRPLFEVTVKEDPTADRRYSGNALKGRQIGFHTDGSGTVDREVELVSTLCVRPARFGGQSRVSNSKCAFELLPRNEQALLQAPSPRENPYDPDHKQGDLKTAPIFQPVESGQYMTFSYHPERVRNGVKLREGRVRPELEAAFCSLEEALETFSCDINLSANEILFVNNRVVAHDRRAFWDDPRAPRLLERFWAGRFCRVA